MSPRELGLTLPLRGVQLIEASAGTGKTHTLVTLYARLVIEAQLEVGQILAVTYTRAATAELRERLRLGLQAALQCAQGEDGPHAASTLELVQAAIAHEGQPALQRRLRHAAAAMDAAPIHTIHGFCQRALADFALEAGQALLPRELLANERELRLEVATEFWREVSRDDPGARTLAALWSGPQRLAATLRDLLAFDALEPIPKAFADAPEDSTEATLSQARERLAQTWVAHADTARQQLHDAWVSGAVHRARSIDEKVDAVWAGLSDWLAADGDDERLHKNTFWYGSAELRGKAAKGKEAQVPRSPLFDAIETWQIASVAAQAQRHRDKIAMLHRLRTFARARLAQLKRERSLIGYDDLIVEVASALQGDSGDAFAARLQAQYRVGLLDEFQDTDPRQSAIFQRLFAVPGAETDDVQGQPRALFLIGDPKQAIYRFRGGDVVAYLVAAHRADAKHALTQNFRTRPCAITAVETLFQRAGPRAFAHDDIVFHPVQPGSDCHDQDFLRNGVPAPALTVLTLDDSDAKTSIDEVRAAAADACAAAVLDLLRAGAEGRALRRRKNETLASVTPGDIAVLVEQNDDTLLVCAALSALGIPSVASGRESVFATPEAEDLRYLLQALRAPGDEARLRAALATTLLGFDAAALDALDTDESDQRHWQERLQDWRQRCERVGPLAVVNLICAEQAARLLRLPAGERRLANYLQLGEALQELAQAAPGLDALLDTFERRIESADRDNEEELLRLESDADRVVVMTLHKSKGLEFQFVFLPLIATHGATRTANAPPFARYHDGEQRVLHLLGADEVQDRELQRIEREEERAERLRLLYVGLTRARLATWIVWGAAKQIEHTALAWLLHRPADGAAVPTLDRERIAADLQQWRAAAEQTCERRHDDVLPAAIAIRRADTVLPSGSYVPSTTLSVPAARQVQRELVRDWWVYSYSQLAREQRGDREANADQRGAEDELGTTALPETERSRFVGARFGNVLHAALEHADFARWRDWEASEPPLSEAAKLDAALRAEGYASDTDLAEGRPLLTQLISRTLNVRLPEGLRLCELEPSARRDELEFHLGLAPIAIAALLKLLHAHGVVLERQAFGLRRRIEGLLTGRIDLVYRHHERYYLLDYKSNRLGDYTPAALAEAVRDSEYDLQYVLYTLALHRWLRFRIGTDYDYERHFGGVRYLFCRGLDAARDDGTGVHALRPSRALIQSLDALFAGRAEAVA